MAYLGLGPTNYYKGLSTLNTFTGDGSTTTFTLTSSAPVGGANDIQVFVNNVRQEPGASYSYTLGIDGNGNYNQLIFNTAPVSGDSIYVINPGVLSATFNSATQSPTLMDAITTSATTTYTLNYNGTPYYPASSNSCFVSLNGVLQTPGTDFSVSGSTLTFVNATTSSDVINFVLVLGNVLPIGTPGDATVTLAKLSASGTKSSTTYLRGDNTFSTIQNSFSSGSFTGNGSSTTITINSGRAVNDVLVFVNGVCLVPTTDYTISGTTLTFTTAPANAAEIQVRYLG